MLGAPAVAVDSAQALDDLVGHAEADLFRPECMLGGGDAVPHVGPIWASSYPELVPSWEEQPWPFSQIHGHASLVDWATGGMRADDDLASRTVVDPDRRHVTTTLMGGVIVRRRPRTRYRTRHLVGRLGNGPKRRGRTVRFHGMPPSLPVLREYLYVDIVKVRGLLAQLDEGIIETRKVAERVEKVTGGGVKGFAEHSHRGGTDSTSEKAMGDALFPLLEDALIGLGYLRDLSQELSAPQLWDEGNVADALPAGSLARVTAQGHLFDARYIASTFAGILTASQGLEAWPEIAQQWASGSTPLPPKAKNAPHRRQGQRPSAKAADGPRNLEDDLPEVTRAFGTEIGRDFLEGLIRLARGLYAPGVHLFIKPTNDINHTIFARLEEGRQFLDSEPEVLFSRYGMGLQEWTIVGTVGSHDLDHERELEANFAGPGGSSLSRVGMAEYINNFMQILGRTGMSNLPQWPSFSIVPLAVYRTVPPWGAPLAGAS